MTDHHTEAERLLQESGDIPASDEANYIAMAQVHATLALADAVRDQNEPSFDDLIAANREGMQEDYDRNTRHDAEIERLREEVAMTERYRDDVIQACAAAEHERDIAACRLGGIGNALGLAAVDTADLPRLVRELRDERDKLRVAAPDACNQCARRAVAAEREFAELRKALWGVIRGKATLGADDMNRLMSLSFYDPDTAEPASREPETPRCKQTAENLHREPDGASELEPTTPGFKPGDRVWLIHKRCAATFQRYLSADGTCLVRLGDGTNYPTVTALLCHPGGDDR